MRHDNDNCDLTIQVVANVKPVFVDVAQSRVASLTFLRPNL